MRRFSRTAGTLDRLVQGQRDTGRRSYTVAMPGGMHFEAHADLYGEARNYMSWLIVTRRIERAMTGNQSEVSVQDAMSTPWLSGDARDHHAGA